MLFTHVPITGSPCIISTFSLLRPTDRIRPLVPANLVTAGTRASLNPTTRGATFYLDDPCLLCAFIRTTLKLFSISHPFWFLNFCSNKVLISVRPPYMDRLCTGRWHVYPPVPVSPVQVVTCSQHEHHIPHCAACILYRAGEILTPGTIDYQVFDCKRIGLISPAQPSPAQPSRDGDDDDDFCWRRSFDEFPAPASFSVTPHPAAAWARVVIHWLAASLTLLLGITS